MHRIDGTSTKSGYVSLLHHHAVVKSLLLGLFIVFITPFVHSDAAHATQTVPYKVNFQGRLTDNNGNVKPDGTYSMKFRLFNGSTGGSALWTETRDRASGQQVTVTNGLFSVQLGDVATLSPNLFSSGSYPIYLEVELPTPGTATCTTNGCESWSEGAMSPRSPFGSSGYAFNADTVDGIDGNVLARTDGSNTFNGDLATTGTIYSGTDIALNNYGSLFLNGLWNGVDLLHNAAGVASNIYNDPDNGLVLEVADYGAAGSIANYDKALIVKKARDGIVGLVDNGVTYGSNLVSNPGFEFGCNGWVACFNATATDDPYSGLSEYKYTMPTTSSTYDITSRKVAVQPGDQLYTSVKVKTSAATTGQAGLYVQFYNASGVGIGFSDGDYTNPGTNYVTKSWVHTAPAGAAYASMALTVRGSLGAIPATTAGTWKFDDAYMGFVNRTGPAAFRSEVNGAGAFKVQDAGLNAIFSVDTALNSASINAINGRTLPTLNVTQGSSGDASLAVSNATNNYSFGLDATDNKFKLGTYAGTQVSGIRTYSNNMDSGNSNTVLAELVQADSTGTVSKLSLHNGATVSGNGKAAIFSDNGSRTAPLNRLGYSNSVPLTAANSWVDFTLTSSVSVTAGAYYWIAYNVDNNTTQQNFSYAVDGVSAKMYTSQSFSSGTGFPSTWAGGVSEPGLGFGMTMTITSDAQTDQFGTTALYVNQYGQTVLQAAANSTQAFQIQNSDNVQLFNADTINNQITVAKSNNDTTPALKVYQGGAGDASLSIGTGYSGYNIGLDNSDNQYLKFATYGNSTSGVTTPSGNFDSGNANFMMCSMTQAKTSGYVYTTHIRVGAIAGSMMMALYADTGTRLQPGALMGYSPDTTLSTPNSWQAFSIATPSGGGVQVTAGQNYWICFNSSSSTTQQDFADFGTGISAVAYDVRTYSTDPSVTFPSTASLGSLYQDIGWAVNMDVTQSGSADQFAASPFRMGVGGESMFKNLADSSSAFVVQASDGTSLLNLDTARMGVTIKGQSGIFNDVDQRVSLLTVDGSGKPIYRDNVNGVDVKYAGGSITGEAAGMRIDYKPGSGGGGTWDGLRIVADTTGATSGTTSYGIKLEGPTAPGAGQETAQYIGTGWDLGIDIQSGGIQLNGSQTTDPAKLGTTSSNLQMYAKTIAGRVMPAYQTMGSGTNAATPVQASLGFNRINMMTPGYNSATSCASTTTAVSSIGPAAVLGGSSCLTVAPSSTNTLTSTRRTQFTTGTTSGVVSFVYPGPNQPSLWRGNASGLGGFFYTSRFGTSTTSNNNKAFVGLTSLLTVPTNADAIGDSANAHVGMAINANTGNWKIINNVASGAPSTLDLGSNFPVSTSNLYELVLYCAPNGSSIGYRVTNLSNGTSASGSLSSNIPSSTTFMTPVAQIANATTANTVLDFGGWYIESDL